MVYCGVHLVTSSSVDGSWNLNGEYRILKPANQVFGLIMSWVFGLKSVNLNKWFEDGWFWTKGRVVFSSTAPLPFLRASRLLLSIINGMKQLWLSSMRWCSLWIQLLHVGCLLSPPREASAIRAEKFQIDVNLLRIQASLLNVSLHEMQLKNINS